MVNAPLVDGENVGCCPRAADSHHSSFFPTVQYKLREGGPLDLPTENLVIGGGSHDEFVALRPGGEERLEEGAHPVETGRVEALRVLLGPPEADGGDVARVR